VEGFMTEDARRVRDAQAEWLNYAADVAETLTDDEILSLGRRLRSTTADWLRGVAMLYLLDTVEPDNLRPAEWVMRLLLEERGHTLKSVQLGPRNQE
jgi:hypothetical protein